MKKEILLTNQEKMILVKNLLIEGKTFKEIQKVAHVSPNFITKVKRAEFGENCVDSDNENLKKNKLSKRTQAINLFYKGKTPYEILQELDISIVEVKKAQVDYLELLNLDNLSEIVQNNKNSNLLNEFYNLFKIFKELRIDTIEKVQEIKELVESYPHLKYEISNLHKEIYNLKKQKQIDEQILNDINYKISLANASYNKIEHQIQNKKIVIQNLECLIDKMQSPEAYNNFKKIIEPIIKDEYWYKTTILPLLIVSVFEVIRNDPMGKSMILDFYNNNPVSFNNNKETNIEEMINSIFNSYLPIMMDLHKYSQLLHDNLLQIYSLYLFNIIKISHPDNLVDMENNQKECSNLNRNNI